MTTIHRISTVVLLTFLLLAWWFVPGTMRTAASYPDTADIGQSFILDWSQDGDDDGGQLGYAVGTSGNVNGDSYADIIIGAPTGTYTVDKEGVAYVFYGSPGGPDSFPDWTAGGGSGQSGSLFGGAVSTAGDVNGDGYDDVIVGAENYKNLPLKGTFGGAFVFYGSFSGLASSPGWTLVGNQKDSYLGIAVGTAGDVNGDTYDDVIIGASGYGNGEALEGMMYVFFGATDGLTTTRVFTFESNQTGAIFGTAVGAAGDVNGDGYDDITVGAPQYDVPGTADVGAAFVFFGTGDGISSTYTLLYGDQGGSRFGDAVSAAGDVNHDGYGDILVGAPFYDNNPQDTKDAEGAAFIFLGSSTGVITTPHRRLFSGGSGVQFGASVGAVGDANDDGYADVIIGAPYYTYDQSAEGAAFVYLGSPSGLSAGPIWRGEGNKADAMFGYAVGSAGDVDGDNFVDIIVGAPEYKIETVKRGRASVYLGTGDDTVVYNYIYLPLVMRASF